MCEPKFCTVTSFLEMKAFHWMLPNWSIGCVYQKIIQSEYFKEKQIKIVLNASISRDAY